MKKLIQICSVICIAIAFSIVSANAQTTHKIKAQVPFDFSVGGKHYDAGKYDLKVSDTRTGAIVQLFDDRNSILATLLVSGTADQAADGAKLVFSTYEGQLYLTRISTSNGSYRVARSKDGWPNSSRSDRAKRTPQVVALALKTEL
jgi:hypothetical protein